MKKILVGGLAAAALLAPLAVAGSAHASGAPVMQDTTVLVPTSADTLDLPALNSQFTSEKLTITGGNSYFGPNGDQITWYLPDGSFNSNDGGFWNGEHGYGTLRAPDVHPGAVIYSLDHGVTWKALDSGHVFTSAEGKHITLGYNDVPGLFGDNTGTGFVVNIHRDKPAV